MLYMDKTPSNKFSSKDQLYTFLMEKGDDLMEHLNIFSHCTNDLSMVKVKYKKEDKA